MSPEPRPVPILRKLEADGHLDLSYRRISILAPDALRKMLRDSSRDRFKSLRNSFGNSAGTSMIRNGLYAVSVEIQDGIEGGDNGVVVLRDGTIRGGNSFFYFFGSYSCSGVKWKGEVTSQEHTPLWLRGPSREK